MILAELAKEAGFPNGVINIIHGSKRSVDFLINEPRVKAISFVGSTKAGEYIHAQGSARGKRVQANLGAKNHAVILPDSNKNHALNAITGAAFGAAGQRCMALSTLITLPDTKSWLADLVDRAKALKAGPGFDAESDLGPVISPDSKARIEELVASAEADGAEILLDGRGYKPEGYPDGNWVSDSFPTHTIQKSCSVKGSFLGWTYNHLWSQAVDALLQGRSFWSRACLCGRKGSGRCNNHHQQ